MSNFFKVVDNSTPLFVDMDGTVVTWGQIDAPEDLLRENYFRDLPPYEEVVAAVKKLVSYQYLDIYILSAYMPESSYALREKGEWLDTYLPEIDKDHRIFVPCGVGKSQAAKGKLGVDAIDKKFFLLDDYTTNLNEWAEAGGTAIKLRNGVNGRTGTWQGPSVTRYDSPENIVKNILSIIREKL